MAETMLGPRDTMTNETVTDFSFINMLSMVFNFVGYGGIYVGKIWGLR